MKTLVTVVLAGIVFFGTVSVSGVWAQEGVKKINKKNNRSVEEEKKELEEERKREDEERAGEGLEDNNIDPLRYVGGESGWVFNQIAKFDLNNNMVLDLNERMAQANQRLIDNEREEAMEKKHREDDEKGYKKSSKKNRER